MKNIPLVGYSDRLSVRPKESIEFKVSSTSSQPFSAELFRSISADPNPAGIGIVEECASQYFTKAYFASKERPFFPGSYGATTQAITIDAKQHVTLSVIIYPTLQTNHKQTILAIGNTSLYINQDGAATFTLANNTISIKQVLKLHSWYQLSINVDITGNIYITQTQLNGQYDELSNTVQGSTFNNHLSGIVSVAARVNKGVASDYFNGKIESPKIVVDGTDVAKWDFSIDIPTCKVTAVVGSDLILYNFPTRATTGSTWDGSEMNWCHKPKHYASIHFHEDDIYNFEWQSDFSFTIPNNMPSGIYVMRIKCAQYEDAMPFYVCAPLGKPSAKLCVLISTFTYTIYGNHARIDYNDDWQQRTKDWGGYPYNPAKYKQYGLSTYNNHLDGSGICHASHQRVLFNLRPGYLTFNNTTCSGLRHFQADSHLISWLHAKGIDYDIITDTELDNDGIDAIKCYRAITTATHPEYHTSNTLNALMNYRNNGGALHYLGGNGFYWRIAQHSEHKDMLEIRRAEDGIRAWAAEPGEYYHAFDGAYGGLWRRNGRPPEQLVGIGFVAQGNFHGYGYHRVYYGTKYNWIFKGITDDIIGDFGFSGNGAAGFELDCIDTRLGTPANVVLLAQSMTSNDKFMLVPEEQLTHLSNLTGQSTNDALRADMIYFEVEGGGLVFSTGSITFCGSLPWNGFNNNISRLLENIIYHSLKKPLNNSYC